MITADFDETSRLVLMYEPTCDLGQFAVEMRSVADIDPVDIAALWARYRGFDGRPPTHDVETGKRRGRK